jgi:acetyl-CoA synthetase
VPTIVRSWRRDRIPDGLDWSAIRLFSSTGEASDPDDYAYLMQLGGPPGEIRPIIEYCGGTEVGGAYITSTLLEPNEPSIFNTRAMGSDFVVLDSNGRECQPGEVGEVFLVPPALGLTTRLLNRDNFEVYYAGCPTMNDARLRRHGDLVAVLEGGRYRSLGRADDTMNLGGIKTSSAEIEQALAGTVGIIEAAAVGIPPTRGGPDRLVMFVVTASRSVEELRSPLQLAIRERVNPLFHVHDVVSVASLPRTASNKVIRRLLREEYQRSERKG